MGEEPVAADLGERVLGRVELPLGFEATLVSGRTIAQPGFVLHSVLDATDTPD